MCASGPPRLDFCSQGPKKPIGEVTARGNRHCRICDAVLAADNSARLCTWCSREHHDQRSATAPTRRPDAFFDTQDFQTAFGSQQIGKIFRAYRKHPYYFRLLGKALSQEVLGRWLGLTQAQVSRLENGKPEDNITSLRHYAEVLQLPQRMLWFDLPDRGRVSVDQTHDSAGENVEEYPALPWVVEQQDPDTGSVDAVIDDRLADPVVLPCVSHDVGIAYLTLSRREFLKAAGMSCTGSTSFAIAVSAFSGLAPNLPRRAETFVPARKTTPVTSADVEAVKSYTQIFRHLDNKFGGGHAHALATQFLGSDVASMLRGSYTEKVGRELHGAAAQLAHLAAWTAYDMGMHDLAKFYFGQALELTVGAGDPAFGGEILAAKGHQAIHLGRPRQAIELARASQNAAKEAAVPLLLAEAHALEANAHALLGGSGECARNLSQAESAFTQAESDQAPEWLQYLDEGYLAARIAHSLRDAQDLRPARAHAQQAVEMSDELTRTRAFNNVILASTYIESDLDEACSIGTDTLEVAVRLQSSRLIRYIGEFRQRLNEFHEGEPSVERFTARIVDALRS